MHDLSSSNSAQFCATVLIADDDPNIRSILKLLFLKDGHRVVEASDGQQAIKNFTLVNPDIILLDIAMPIMDGLQACQWIRQSPQGKTAPILLITAYTDDASIQKAFESGATDFIVKPVQPSILRQRALHLAHARQAEKRLEALQTLEQVQNYTASREKEECALIGQSPIFANICELIRCAAAGNAPVLITGETGTGKSLVAKTIHHTNPVRRGAFISVNCAALPETLIEAELFGAERGAYTGSVATRKGTFELANNGTLFLDEIGEMPIGLQSKLLGALEDQKIRRIGGEILRDIDARIIAATNIDPNQAINTGKLRTDLYYRLNVISIHLPPLRERREDIPSLCNYFLGKFAPNQEIRLPDSEMAALMEYEWPGNVREMRNVIERCLILQTDSAQIMPSKLIDSGKTTNGTAPELSPKPSDLYTKNSSTMKFATMEEVERQYIQDVFQRLQCNQTRTAKALEIPLTTLKRKLKRYGIAASRTPKP